MSVRNQARTRSLESLEHALGPEIRASLADADVSEIMLRSDGTLWLDRHSCGLVPGPESFDERRAEALLTSVAGILGEVLTPTRPYLECELPLDGSRVSALIPPITPGPSFSIRKRAKRPYRLEDYLASGILDAETADRLREALAPADPSEKDANVVIAGGPGSGKTTLSNALLAEIAEAEGETEFIALVEDTYELQCQAPCCEYFQTTDEFDLRFMVKRAMRFRPDRLIVGEVRGAEALDLLTAWNTGLRPSLTTVHANSAVDALHRLDHLAQEGGVRSAAWRVAKAVGLVAFIVRTPNGRRVTEVIRVNGLTADGEYDVEPV